MKNNKQKPFKLSISEDTFRSVPIFEKLEHLGTDMFITDYVGNVVNLVKNKTDTYRILYDSKIDKYIIANSYDYTHFEMLRKAYDEGYYIDINDYIENVSDGLHNYFHDGVYGDSNDSSRTIVCYIVYPDSGTKWLYQDSYDAGYLLNADEFRFQNGARVVVGIKGNGFTDPQFFKAFGKPRILSKKELMENITKFNYLSEDTCCVASKTSYIDEDGLDKNGIYYFGNKPKAPVNWKDYKRNDNKRFKLKERLYNGIHIPPCPKEELRQLSVSKMNNITLRNPNGDESEFIVFKSKVQTKQFINSLLSDAFFPMARSQTYLNDYLHDKESYIEDMTNFYNNEAWLSDSEGQSIWAYSDGKNYLFDGTYEDAIEAIKLRNIESFIMSDSWGEYVYNAYIVFEELSNDPEDGMWRAVDGINGYLDGSYDDYRWFNYFGTYIEIPSWANSIKDILIK